MKALLHLLKDVVLNNWVKNFRTYKLVWLWMVNRKRFAMFVYVTAFIVIVLLSIDKYVETAGKNRIYRDIKKVPYKQTAVVLGTAKYVEGRRNLYYEYRLDAAVQLWEAGKVDAILVSGDNSRKNYDEPSNMKSDLTSRGVPAQFITVDYAGFRTLDSVVRAEKVFGLKDYIVVSQPFHCCRAVFLAKKHNQKVVGWCASNVGGAIGFKQRLREVLARNKAVWDIVTGKGPKYLGKRERVICRKD